MNQIDLVARRAVVTGGGQGIGRAIAERLLASGAAVSLWDRDAALVGTVAGELSTDGRIVRHAVVDVANHEAAETATRATIDALGGIDILVANAGIAGPNSRSGNIHRTRGNGCLTSTSPASFCAADRSSRT